MHWLILAALAAAWYIHSRTPKYESGVDRDHPPRRPGRFPGEVVKFAEPGRGYMTPQYGWRWDRIPDTGEWVWQPQFGPQ